MTLQPEDFWSFYEWLMRPDAFLQSAALKGIVLLVLSIVLGLIVGYIIAAARYGPGEGFYSVARIIRLFFRFDLPGTSLRRILALAGLAFKEAIRRKVLFVVGLFVIVLMLAGWFLNSDSDDPARLYIGFVLTGTNYLMLLLALFISTFSLPIDIQSKTIYTIVTKPVRPTEIVLGRILGFIGVGTVMLVPMGLCSYLFVTRGIRHTHLEVVDVEEVRPGEFEGETDHVRGHHHRFTLLPPPEDYRQPASGRQVVAIGLTNRVRGHQHVVKRYDDGDFVIEEAINAFRARVPSYGEIQFFDRNGEPKNAGIDIGAERVNKGYSSLGLARVIGVAKEKQRIQHGYVEGGTLCMAEFTFSNVTPERYRNFIPIDLSVRAYRSYKGDIESGIRGSLTLKHPKLPRETEPIEFVVDEYEIDELEIPLEKQGTDGDQTRMLNIFEDIVDENGEMKVIIRCLDRSQYLGVTRSGVYLRPGDSSFQWNLTKAYISIWLQMTVIIAFGVMFSTFLSGPVAMVATFVCALLGFFAEQIYDTRYYIDANISRGGGPIESMVRIIKQDAMTTELDVDTTAAAVIKTADAGIVYAMDAIATALPNLPKMVATAEYAASGFDIFGALLLRHAVAALGYVILAFVISYFCLKSREIAA